TSTFGTSKPFSAMNMRTMRGLGPTELYSFMFPPSLGPQTNLPPRLDQNFRMLLGISQLGESALHPVKADLGGDQRRRVDLSFGQEPQRTGEFLGRVAQHELEAELLDDTEHRL